MKNQALLTVWCNISGGAGGEIWHWSLSGVKGLISAKYSRGRQRLENLKRESARKGTWESACLSATLCRSSRAWLTCFSRSRAVSIASKPLPHASLSGFWKINMPTFTLSVGDCKSQARNISCLQDASVWFTPATGSFPTSSKPWTAKCNQKDFSYLDVLQHHTASTLVLELHQLKQDESSTCNRRFYNAGRYFSLWRNSAPNSPSWRVRALLQKLFSWTCGNQAGQHHRDRSDMPAVIEIQVLDFRECNKRVRFVKEKNAPWTNTRSWRTTRGWFACWYQLRSLRGSSGGTLKTFFQDVLDSSQNPSVSFRLKFFPVSFKHCWSRNRKPKWRTTLRTNTYTRSTWSTELTWSEYCPVIGEWWTLASLVIKKEFAESLWHGRSWWQLRLRHRRIYLWSKMGTKSTRMS